MSKGRGKRVPTFAYILIPLFAIGTVLGLVFIAHRIAWVKPWVKQLERSIQEIEDYANWGYRKDE
jgi:hypothetical protein